MKYTIEQLSYVVPAISIGFLFIITSINVYFKIRRRFPATVNCWFCNENSKVPYDNLNKFTCPKCDQYNGFAEDGDYNCDIPAQRSARLNKWKTSSFQSTLNGSISGRMMPVNGLCEPCNRNQELKVQQLASFEPENEAYFDEEIEEYRYKLEQAYRLCPRCERHLKRTLNKVKTNILGSKLKQIGTKGLHAFNLNVHETANKVIVHKKRLTFARISLAALIMISLLQLYAVSNQMSITKPKLDTIFNASTTTSILTILSYMAAVKILALQAIQYVLALPYISLVVTFMQMLVKYVYAHISGDIWSVVNASVSEFIDATVEVEKEINPGFSTLTTNVSGCFLSIFLLFLFGLGWSQVLSLLLWSFSMIIPTVHLDAKDLKSALIMDSIQLILVWTSVLLSTYNFIVLPSKQMKITKDQNSSFHRINSEMNSDASDESDAESELNTSMRSNMSSFSKRSAWNETKVLNSTITSKAPSLYSLNSLRQRPFGVSSQSIASTQPLSDLNASFASEQGFYRDSQMDLTCERLNSSQRPLMSPQPSDIFSRKQCPSAMSLTSLNKTFNTSAEQNFRSASRNSFYDIPNDFESGITQLSISGLGDRRFNYRKQTNSVFGSSDPFRDSLRHRKTVLSPSRLSLNENHHPVNQSSWLAGGYWNSTSPQKKNPHHLNEFRPEQRIHSKEMFPIISRTSSKSSGFESRENSLCDDTETDRTFLMHEPKSLTETANTPNGLIKPQPHKPINGFISMNGNSYQQPASHAITPTSDSFTNSFSDKQSISPNFSLLSRSLSQVSLQKPANQSMHFQNHNNALNPRPFASMTRDLPMQTFQRGSLIKLQDLDTIDQ